MKIKIDKKCVECGVIGIYNKYFDKYICRDCRQTDKYTLVTKTNAKKLYLLIQDELDDLTSFEGKSSYGPATYHIQADLINLSCTKHNTNKENLFDTLEKIIEDKENKKQEKREIKEKKNKELQDKRKKKLILEFGKAGLKFRDDSMLCKKYIHGDKEYALDYIVERMSQMKYLYEYCHMDECKSIAYNSYQEELHAGYFPDCSVSEHAEMIALEKYSNGNYPDVYPWQT
jgi:hypothetical protein